MALTAFGSVGFLEQKLALQVAPFDKIAVDQPEPADAGSCQCLGLHGPQGTATNDRYGRNTDPILASFPTGMKRL